MGAVIGLTFGVGAALILWAATTPRRSSSGRRVQVPPGLLAGVIASATIVFVVILIATRTPPVAVAFAVIGGYGPIGLARGRERKRLREHAEVWPEAVDNLASAVRAGLSLAEALSGLADRGPAPLRPHFEAFALDHRAGARLEHALDRLKESLADPVGDRVVEALRIAHEVGGGDLGRLLRDLSGYLRDDARTRSELEARQTWTISGARLAVGAPWAVLLLLSFSPDVIGRYASPAGAMVLMGGGALCVVAYALMMRIGRLPEPRRVLR